MRDRLPPDRARALAEAGQTSIFDLEDLAELDRLASAGDRDATIRARFLRFHDANPHVYRELVAMARELKSAGHDRFGLRMLWETLRWRRMLSTTSEDDYRLNDHFIAHYARLMMAREPDLDGTFELRQIRTT